MQRSTHLIPTFLCGFLLLCAVSSCGTIKKGSDEELLVSQEHELRIALSQVREVIKLYNVDHGIPPQDLNDLVTAGYINKLPEDPFTDKSDWIPIWRDCSNTQNCKTGIENVRSSSNQRSSEGTLYKEW